MRGDGSSLLVSRVVDRDPSTWTIVSVASQKSGSEVGAKLPAGTSVWNEGSASTAALHLSDLLPQAPFGSLALVSLIPISWAQSLSPGCGISGVQCGGSSQVPMTCPCGCACVCATHCRDRREGAPPGASASNLLEEFAVETFPWLPESLPHRPHIRISLFRPRTCVLVCFGAYQSVYCHL